MSRARTLPISTRLIVTVWTNGSFESAAAWAIVTERVCTAIGNTPHRAGPRGVLTGGGRSGDLLPAFAPATLGVPIGVSELTPVRELVEGLRLLRLRVLACRILPSGRSGRAHLATGTGDGTLRRLLDEKRIFLDGQVNEVGHIFQVRVVV